MRATALLAGLLIAGCAAPGPDLPAPAPVGVGSCGLEVRTWRIAATDVAALVQDPEGYTEVRHRVGVDAGIDLPSLLSARASGACADEETLDQLARDGFRAVRVPIAELDAIIAELGGAASELRGWHGQATEWREVAERPVGGDRIRAVVAGGRPHRLAEGDLVLALRGWYLPTENGPVIRAELAPEFRPRRERSAATRFRPEEPVRERFESSRVELLLEPGFACVIVGAEPGERWDDEEGTARPGPGTAVAPPVGRLLLEGQGLPRRREIIVLVPHLPEPLFPPGWTAPHVVAEAGEAP